MRKKMVIAALVHACVRGEVLRTSGVLGAQSRSQGVHSGCCLLQPGSCASHDRRTFARIIDTQAAVVALRGGRAFQEHESMGQNASLKGMIRATRPWSWTAGIIPVLLTGALLRRASGRSMEPAGLVNAVIMVITLQASGNLINSYVDHNYGVDTFDTAGDRTIVDSYVSPTTALALAGILLLVACVSVVPTMMELRTTNAARELELTFWTGVAMVYSYTCWPFRLKYRGLGDITVFLLFGPMLMQVAGLLISGKVQHWVLPYGIPAALLTEAILHANNMRDIAQDRRAGIRTVASMIGFGGSRLLYCGLVLSAYLCVSVLAMKEMRGCALSLLTLPLAITAMRKCKAETIRNLDEVTAQMHLLFGVLMTFGALVL